MTVQDEVIQEVQSKNKAKKREEKVQNEMDDAMEALTIIDSAISSGYLLDKHSLEMQKWAKQYQEDINRCKMFIQESDNE